MCPAKDVHDTILTDTIPNNDGSVTCTFGSGACLYDVSVNKHHNAYVNIQIFLHRILENYWRIKMAELVV